MAKLIRKSSIIFATVICLSIPFVNVVEASGSNRPVCVNKTTGVMRFLRTGTKQKCEKGEIRIIWNKLGVIGQTGPTGLTGATGPVGPRGPKGPDGVDATFSIAQLSVCGSGGNELCKVGSRGPGGGFIFFVDYRDQYSEFNYLEAAPISCQGMNKAWSSDSSNSRAATSGWASRGLGAGKANTTALVTSSGSYSRDVSGAAYFADSSTCGGLTDWYLGSIGEVKLMYENLQGIGSFIEVNYWSSSEASATDAWFFDFFSGLTSYDMKSTTMFVRPIRSF